MVIFPMTGTLAGVDLSVRNLFKLAVSWVTKIILTA